MKLHAVYWEDKSLGNTWMIGVFSSLKKAYEYVEKAVSEGNDEDAYEIEPYELDEALSGFDGEN